MCIRDRISTINVENTSGTLDIKSETPVDDNGKTEKTIYTLVGFEDFLHITQPKSKYFNMHI